MIKPYLVDATTYWWASVNPLYLIAGVFIHISLLFTYSTVEASNNFQVTGVIPVPNYSASKEIYQIDSLTDKVTVADSMWVKAGTLAWKQPVPISLEMTFRSNASQDVASLDFHLGAKPSAGVSLPNRIDLYQKSKSTAKYKHIGFWQRKSAVLAEKSAWIKVPVAMDNSASSLLAVIHPGGKMLAIDEVTISLSSAGRESQLTKYTAVEDPLSHSFGLLKSRLKAKTAEVTLPGREELTVAAIDPFAGFSNFATEYLSNSWAVSRQVINNIGIEVDGGGLSGCLTVDMPDYATLRHIESVYSVYGQEIPDALVPIDSCIELTAGKSLYFLLDLDGGEIPIDEAGMSLSFSLQGAALPAGAIDFHFSYLDDAVELARSCLAVNPWSYTGELPFWEKPEKMHQFLVDSGVNVFYLSPAQFPSVNDIGSAGRLKQSTKRLKEHLDLFKGARHIVLFAALDRKINWSDSEKEIKRSIRKWFALLSDEIKKQGFTKNQVLLHPVDEVRGENWHRLMTVVEAIDGIDSNIGIYVNPIFKRKDNFNPRVRRVLGKLKKSVDVWQPRIESVGNVSRDLYLGKHAELWFYQNPQFPAKNELPEFYRNLAKKAVDHGYDGVGFWSITDARKSSPWSDIDGERPDWASLYYRDGQIISSLRWEAFRSGLSYPCGVI